MKRLRGTGSRQMQFIDFLYEQANATNEQIDDLRSKATKNGRNLVDQAYLSGLLDERELLRGIRLGTNAPTVELNQRKAKPEVLKYISGSVAWEMRVLPFSFDSKSKTLSVACKNPDDQELANRLKKSLPEIKCKLYAAVGPILETSIIDNYRDEPLTTSKSSEDDAVEPEEESAVLAVPTAFILGKSNRTILSLGETLAHEGYQVYIADQWSELDQEFKERAPDLVLIDERTPQRGLPELPKTTTIRRFLSVARLFNPSHDVTEHAGLAIANLHLATRILSRANENSSFKPVLIGGLVEKLCQQLRLTAHDHLVTVTAAYLQDIAELYYGDERPTDRQTAFFMIQGLISESDVYPPAVLKVIRKMYCNLSEMKVAEIASTETRNGNVLTTVDYYLRQFPDGSKLTSRRFDLIDQKIRGQIGRLLLPEVAESLLSLLRSTVQKKGRTDLNSRALVLDQAGLLEEGLADVVADAGFTLGVSNAVEQFSAGYHKQSPNLIVLTSSETPEQIESMLQQMMSSGLVLTEIPAFLIYSNNDHKGTANLAKYGLTHCIHYAGDFELLQYRLRQIVDDKEQEFRKRLQVLQELGTHGTLADMNIIDLLQSMGLSHKTLCINVSGNGHQLTMYLDKGQLVYASSESGYGVETVFEAISWDSGVWSVDHVPSDEIPERNIQRSIDSILMEGCYRLDEMNRGELSPTESPAPPSV